MALGTRIRRRFALTDNGLHISREKSGMALRCDLRDPLARVIFYRGYADEGVDRFLRSWLRPGDTYVDVGAHIGYTLSVAIECVGASGTVYAFEPNPETFAKLAAALHDMRAVRKNVPNVIAEQTAVGSEKGEATIHIPLGEHEGNASMASLAGGDEMAALATVPVATLDSLVEAKHVRLLKIDTEGYEARVLDGAEDVLARCDAVLTEINPEALARADSNPEEVIDLLTDAGFEATGPLSGSDFEDVVFVRQGIRQ